MDELDLARVRVAAEDHAARFYGGPLSFGADSAARYTAEGPLSAVCDRHGLGRVWRAVAEVLAERPSLLTDPEPARQRRAAERAARCDEIADQAGNALLADDRTRMLELLHDGERLAPDHLAFGQYSWTELRAIATSR